MFHLEFKQCIDNFTAQSPHTANVVQGDSFVVRIAFSSRKTCCIFSSKILLVQKVLYVETLPNFTVHRKQKICIMCMCISLPIFIRYMKNQYLCIWLSVCVVHKISESLERSLWKFVWVWETMSNRPSEGVYKYGLIFNKFL